MKPVSSCLRSDVDLSQLLVAWKAAAIDLVQCAFVLLVVQGKLLAFWLPLLWLNLAWYGHPAPRHAVVEAAGKGSHVRRPVSYTSVQHFAIGWRAEGHLRVTLAIKHDLGSLLLACERDHVRFGFYAAPRRPASIHNTVFELLSTPHKAVKTSSRGLQHCKSAMVA